MSGHDLVVGGSGMLAGLCENLARAGRVVSVIGRRPERLAALAARCPPGSVRALALDYWDGAALARALGEAARTAGPIERVVCWMHGDADDARRFAGHSRIFVHVLSSAWSDPAAPDKLARDRAAFAEHPDYRQVVLGFMREAGATRWLTDEEISASVGAALESQAPLAIVGTVTPWRDRPA